jgi:outer membrane protein OmpA-like peptidoglycan-associated protein
MKISRYVLLVAFAVGCAHRPPPELIDARAAYQHASQSPAATVTPADLHKAEMALEEAEAAFKDKPKSYEARDLAYVAHRKAQLAEVMANTQLAAQEKAKADEQFTAAQGEALASTRDQLSAAQSSAALSAEKLSATTEKLTAAEKAAKDAEASRDAALASLAATKEEARGLVITLSGSVLFASDKAELLPEAQNRLGQVAEALMTTKKRSLIIEGHTDSQGDDAHNLELSQRRAEAVRSYLISRGYDASLIQARGIGESRPIASNDSAEGRANNRRVEIIVDRNSTAAN